MNEKQSRKSNLENGTVLTATNYGVKKKVDGT